MKKVYISSTTRDLEEFRNAAAGALRKIRYDVIRMEDYVARNERTRAACEADVAECDLYIGIFAWRYGEMPKDNNAGFQSFTELEYRRAALDKPCLIFLLREEAEWPDDLRDSKNAEGVGGERILNLRTELSDTHMPAYFSTPQELAIEVIAAVHQHESTMRVGRLNVIDEIQERLKLGGSFLPNIRDKIQSLGDAEIVEINLGPTPWWTTRLHLLASLASDFTKIRQFVFLDKDDNYLSMASPLEIRRAFTRRWPQLERAYLGSRAPVGAAAPEINHIVIMYSGQIYQAFDNQWEQNVKEDVSSRMLERELGIESTAESVEQSGQRLLQHWEILRQKTPFVVLLAKGKLISIIDRAKMASKIAVESVEYPI